MREAHLTFSSPGFLRWLRFNAVELAVVHNFVWHERWTWPDRGRPGFAAVAARFGRFQLANGLVSLAGNLALMRLMVGGFGWPPIPSALAAVAVCALVNFAAGELWVFARSGAPALLVVALAAAAAPARGAAGSGPLPGESDDWERYARAVEARIEGELQDQTRFLATDFLRPDAAAAARRALLGGELRITKVIERDASGAARAVDRGMVHHWRGAVFVPGVDLQHVMSRVENPGSGAARPPEVLQSRVLERGPGSLRLFLKLERTKIVTVVYNTEHQIRFARHGPRRAWSSSRAVKIAELADANTPAEREKPQGSDRGFLRRLNSYWRYEEVAGGVLVECESISLSRTIPRPLEPLVRPIVDRIARESMSTTLVSTRARLGGGALQAGGRPEPDPSLLVASARRP